MLLGSNPISWSSRKQHSVSHSSTEAEYRTIAHTTSELCWLLSLLQELHVESSSVPTIYCDNLGTIYVCANPKLHSKMKHVHIDFHFVHEKVQAGALRVSHILNNDQLADVFTKPLSKHAFRFLRSKISVLPRPLNLEGG